MNRVATAPSPQSSPSSSSSSPTDGVDEPAAACALRRQAIPLVTLIARLRDMAPTDPAGLRRALAAAVNRFEADARAAGAAEASVAAASYMLCAWADEQFEAAPWGAEGAGLLQCFHGEAHRGDKLLRLLARLAEKPSEHRALLELFHTCLSLGLRASTALDNHDHENLRSRVYLAVQQAAPVPPLVAPWRSAAAAASPPRPPRFALPAVLLLAVLALGVYSVSQLELAARVDEVLASLQGLLPARSAAATPAAGRPTAPPRLAAELREDIEAGRLAVRDEALRSVVQFKADELREARRPLERVGAALTKQPGKVLVIGYTDGADAPTPRTPSAWHQAMEWARTTADVLRPQVTDARLAVEARVDVTGTKPRRRVEIVLFPE